MGKTADNERIKLRATWYNNLSIALTFTGVLIRVFSLYKVQNFLLLDDWTSGRSHPTVVQVLQLVLTLVAFCLALYSAAHLHNSADKEIAKIQD
jgi:uncharacterized membrane protein YidH (DUF202 family)